VDDAVHPAGQHLRALVGPLAVVKKDGRAYRVPKKLVPDEGWGKSNELNVLEIGGGQGALTRLSRDVERR